MKNAVAVGFATPRVRASVWLMVKVQMPDYGCRWASGPAFTSQAGKSMDRAACDRSSTPRMNTAQRVLRPAQLVQRLVHYSAATCHTRRSVFNNQPCSCRTAARLDTWIVGAGDGAAG